MTTERQDRALDLSPVFAPAIVGASKHARQMAEFITMATPSRHTVFLFGETGTGKDHMAKAIHRLDKRCTGNFVTVNCSAVQKDLFESEFFGHKMGSFTSAVEHKVGLFEFAEQGTIFLNEIGELATSDQAKLLGVLDEGHYRRVGDTTVKRVKARIIAATNVDLTRALRQGEFRSDLYHRLSELPFEIAPLRAREDDIPILTEHFLAQEEESRYVTDDARSVLRGYHWPGNVRELKNVVSRAFLYSDKDKGIRSEHIRPFLLKKNDSAFTFSGDLPSFKELQREYIKEILVRCGGNQRKAAALARIKTRVMYYKVRQFGLQEFVDELKN